VHAGEGVGPGRGLPVQLLVPVDRADELPTEDRDLVAGEPPGGGVPELLGGERLACRPGGGTLRVGGRAGSGFVLAVVMTPIIMPTSNSGNHVLRQPLWAADLTSASACVSRHRECGRGGRGPVRRSGCGAATARSVNAWQLVGVERFPVI
jgi:hypothetical protein